MDDLLLEKKALEDKQKELFDTLPISLRSVGATFPDLVLYLSDMNGKMATNRMKIENLMKTKESELSLYALKRKQYDGYMEELPKLESKLAELEKLDPALRPYVCSRGDGDCDGTAKANDNYYKEIEAKKAEIRNRIESVTLYQVPIPPNFELVDNDLLFLQTELSIQEESRK